MSFRQRYFRGNVRVQRDDRNALQKAMRVLTAVVVIALLSGALGLAAASEVVALDMVKRLRLGDNLGALGFQVASKSQTYRIITQSVGPDKARTLVTEELERAKPKYQEQWDKNLAASYAPLFTTDELQSIGERQRQSPHFNKFLSKQNEVGSAMQAKSSDLLKQYVTEAMTNAFRRITPTK